MINRMTGHLPHWKEIIHQSFLPEEMKAAYYSLLEKRKTALDIN